jgi:peptidoglycan/LPS O-acetylase OafA/YrhL
VGDSTTRSANTELARIDQFDAVRAFAFLAVFAFHAVHAPFGYAGVDLFFVLSGFLITRNLLALRATATTSSSFAAFFFRRILRIIPPYYLAIALIFVLEPFPAHELPWYLGFASNVRDTLKPVLPGPLVTLWSIAVEEQFYLVWPFLVLLLPRRTLGAVFVTVIVGAIVFRWCSAANDDAVYRLTLSRMDTLAAGALLALVESRDVVALRRSAKPVAILGVVAALVFAVLYHSLPTFRHFSGDALYDVVGYSLITIICVALLLSAYVAGPRARAVLCHPWLRHIGKVSYVAYLVHVLVLDVVRRMDLRGGPTIAIALASTIAVASASWYLLEQPLQRFRGSVRPVPRTAQFSNK